MSYRYIDANDLVDKVDAKTQDFINEMPCMFADIKPLNQHINIDEIRADERAKVIDEIAEAFNEHLFDSPMINPIMTRNEILLFLKELKG